MPDFRSAHAWLRGYSDGQVKGEVNPDVWPEYRAQYIRGYARGLTAVPRGIYVPAVAK